MFVFVGLVVRLDEGEGKDAYGFGSVDDGCCEVGVDGDGDVDVSMVGYWLVIGDVEWLKGGISMDVVVVFAWCFSL